MAVWKAGHDAGQPERARQAKRPGARELPAGVPRTRRRKGVANRKPPLYGPKRLSAGRFLRQHSPDGSKPLGLSFGLFRLGRADRR